MRLSKRCEHGLKAAVQLALHDEKGYLQAREIALTESLPGKFIESILSSLRAASLLESKVGARGGYKLAKPASEIFVADLIRALEGDESVLGGESGTPGASAMAALNHRIDDALDDAVGSLTLADLMGEPETMVKTVRLGGDSSSVPPSTAGDSGPAARDGVAASVARPFDGALSSRS